MSVEVRTKAILKEARSNSDDGCAWLLFDNKSRDLDARTGLKDALQRAGLFDSDDDAYAMLVSDPVPHPKGAIMFVDHTSEADAFPSVLDAVARDLTAAGYSGVIRVVSPEYTVMHDPTQRFGSFTATMRLDLGPWATPSGALREPTWNHDPAELRALVEPLVGWTILPGATHSICCGPVVFRADAANLIDLALSGLRVDTVRTAVVSAVDVNTVRSVDFTYSADILVRERADPGVGEWAQTVAELRALLVTSAARGVGHGFIKRGHMNQGLSLWQTQLPVGWPLEFPMGGPAGMDHPPVRLNEHVPDAFGIQLLTEQHMSKLGNLSNWDVERLPDGHCLVAHRDLAAWFAGPGPSADLLQEARNDFEPILLARQDIYDYRTVGKNPTGSTPQSAQ